MIALAFAIPSLIGLAFAYGLLHLHGQQAPQRGTRLTLVKNEMQDGAD